MTTVVTSLFSGLAFRRAPLLPDLGDQETNITRKRTVNWENAIAPCFNGGHGLRGAAARSGFSPITMWRSCPPFLLLLLLRSQVCAVDAGRL
jgi:hypothetical protein